MPTPPKANTSSGSAATATTTGMAAALDFVNQLEYSVGQLKHELQTYNEPGTVGRDTILLRSFFDQVVGRVGQIAQACKITWTPPQSTAAGRR